MDAPFIVPKELESPIRSARLLAIQKVFFEGNSEDVLTALEIRELIEEEEECRLLVKQAIQAVRRRLGKVASEALAAAYPVGFHRRFIDASAKDRLDLIEDLDAIQRSTLAPLAPDWLAHERDQGVAAALLRAFGEFWPQERLNVTVATLASNSMSARLAALDLLVRRSPQLIADQLEALAGSDDPGIQALAIRGLFSLEPSRALYHLSNMLLSPNPHLRRTGLNVCRDLPFDKVKPLVLQFIAVENDLELLDYAGYYFKVNPDVESPYRLWEIAEESASVKAAVLKRVLKGICEALGNSNPGYFQQLQDWIYRRAASKFVQDCIARIAQTDGADLHELPEAVKKHLQSPIVRTAFEEALGWPIPDAVRQSITGLLNFDRNAKIAGTPENNQTHFQAPPTEKADASRQKQADAFGQKQGDAFGQKQGDAFGQKQGDASGQKQGDASGQKQGDASGQKKADASRQKQTDTSGPKRGETPPAEKAESVAGFSAANSEKDILSRAAAWEKSDQAKARPLLKKFLSNGKISEKSKGALLRTAIRLELDDFVQLCHGWLKNPSETLVAASIDYLSRFDPDGFFPLIGQFFRRQPSQRILNAAVKSLQKADQAQAVSYLLILLKDPQPAVQKMALGCIVYIDFPLIRGPLAAFLSGTHSRDLLEAGLCLFMANPEPENLNLLSQVEKSLPDDLARLSAEVRGKTEALLTKYGRFSPPVSAPLNPILPASELGSFIGRPSNQQPSNPCAPPSKQQSVEPSTQPSNQTSPQSSNRSSTQLSNQPSNQSSTQPSTQHSNRQSGRQFAQNAIQQAKSHSTLPPAAYAVTPPMATARTSAKASATAHRKPTPSAVTKGQPPSPWWMETRVIVSSGLLLLVILFFSLIHAFTSASSSNSDQNPDSTAFWRQRSNHASDTVPASFSSRASLFDEFRRLKKGSKVQ